MENKPKRKFAPKAVGRRSEKEREESAPVVKEEPKERQPFQPGVGPRRRREIKGEYLDDVQGPLSAPSLVDPRGGQRRAFGGGGGGGGGGYGGSGAMASRSGVHAQQTGGAREPQGDRVNIADDNGFFAPQVVSKEALQSSEEPVLDHGNLYLFNVPKLEPAEQGKDKVKKEEKPEDEDGMQVDSTRQVGTLRKHASGKVTMLIGDQVYDLTTGVPTNSVQDVVLLRDEKAYKLGSIDGRMVLVPNFA